MKSWSWVLLILFTILIKWISWYPGWVEENYSKGIYPFIARVQRILFGWLPFSIGDLFYGFLLLIIFYKTFLFFKALIRKKITRKYLVAAMQQAIFFFLLVYVFFNLLWGLNYDRRGIAFQLGLEVKPYNLEDLDTVAALMQEKVNYYAQFVTEEQRDSFDRKRILLNEAGAGYKVIATKYPFLAYSPKSIKASLFSYAGNYLGFQGYYNPFSGEGQVNTTVPRFLEPFIASHEIAHQIGYAKENEANFVGYLACKLHPSNAFRYSIYFDMYNYAVGEIARRDSSLAIAYQQKLHPQVINDIREFRAFLKRHKNPAERIVMWFYGQYLKANNQPAGKRSYNEVVAWLIAYYKKFGKDAL
jgi:hypothetical protein